MASKLPEGDRWLLHHLRRDLALKKAEASQLRRLVRRGRLSPVGRQVVEDRIQTSQKSILRIYELIWALTPKAGARPAEAPSAKGGETIEAEFCGRNSMAVMERIDEFTRRTGLRLLETRFVGMVKTEEECHRAVFRTGPRTAQQGRGAR